MAAVMRAPKRNSEGSDNLQAPNIKRRRHSIDSEKRGSTNSDASISQISNETVDISDAYVNAEQTSRYSRGAIISMRLINFQVATDSTFSFGPFLNVVLGSNGTGKSTIINAIYLLFRGNLGNLDRKNPAEFIQYGKAYSTVSAQIQGDSGQKNPIIAVRIRHQKRLPGQRVEKPQWYVNGEACSEERIDNLITKFHIQVNNLCQFLPQFRVAAFSGETAQQRLVSTEEAIGYDGMIEDHRRLADSGFEISDLTKDVADLSQQTERLSEKKDLFIEKITRLEKANETKEKADMFSRVITLAKYYAVEKEAKQLCDDLDAAKKELRKFDNGSRDKLRIINESESQFLALKEKHDSMGADFSKTSKTYREQMRAVLNYRGRSNDSLFRIEKLREQIVSISVRIESYTKDHQDVKIEVAELKKKLEAKGTSLENFKDRIDKIKNLEDIYTRTEAQSRSLVDEKARISRQIRISEDEETRDKAKLTQFAGSSSGVRSASDLREHLRGDNGSMERSVAFIQKHQDSFEKPIIMPALLSLNITDSHILPIFAEVTSLIHLQKFVCQTQKDQQRLTELAAETGGIDIKTTFVSQATTDSAASDRELSKKYKALGFDGMISEKLDGPEPMMAFMKSLGITKVPYSLTTVSSETRDKMKAATVTNSQFADRGTFYQIQRSKYGARLPTETTKPLSQNPPAWAKFMLRKDNSLEINKLQQHIETSKTRISNLKSQVVKLGSEISESHAQVSDVRDQLREAKSKIGEEQNLRRRLGIAESRISDLETKNHEGQNQREEIINNMETQIKKLNADLGALTKCLSDLPPEAVNDLQSFYYKQQEHKSLMDDARNRLGHLQKSLKTQRESKELNIANLKQTLRSIKDRQRNLHSGYEGAISWLRDHNKLEEGTNEARSTSVDDLEDQVSQLNAAVVLHDQGVESIASLRQQLNIVETQLAEDTRKLRLSSEKLDQLSASTGEIRTRWEEAITSMVRRVSERYSEMFSKLGCRGNVTLNREDPLAIGTWGIDINLAFREEEEVLSKLSKFRQSGGERAVSTAIYLLALQDMAVAPFRVLDEINQGMDEKNERVTLKYFVEMACEPNRTSGKAQQYFLVTPKLIPNMPVHRNMNITFIFGGVAVSDTKLLMPSTKPKESMHLLEEHVYSEDEDEDKEDEDDDNEG